MDHGYKKQINIPFIEAVLKAESELIKEGFVILCRIDVREMLKNKLYIEYGNYVVFIAANPSFTYWSLQEDKDSGLLMPFNIAVYEENDKKFVSILPSSAITTLKSNDLIADIAKKVEKKMKKVIDNI